MPDLAKAPLVSCIPSPSGAPGDVCPLGNVYLRLPEVGVYWGRGYGRLAIATSQLQRSISRIVDVTIAIVAAGGIFAGVVHLGTVAANGGALARGPLLAPFWLGVLAGFVLTSRVGWRRSGHGQVQRRSFEVEAEPALTESRPPLTSWVEASACATEGVLGAVEEASAVAARDSGSTIQPLHLLIGLLRQRGVAGIVARLGLPATQLADELERLAITDSVVTRGGSSNLSEGALSALLAAYWHAYRGRRPQLDVGDLLLAVAESDERVARLLYDLSITPAKLQNAAVWLAVNEQLHRQYVRFRAGARFKPRGAMNRSYTAVATPALDSISQDLTQLARLGVLTVAVGREQQVAEMLRVLESGCGALLVGEPGVGKSTIVYALASAMAAEEVPVRLQDRRLVSISVPAIVAGAGQAGAAEARIVEAFEEVRRAGNVILCVEDIHNLVGAGGQGEGNLDLGEVFAEGLRSSGALVIGTTTPHDRARYLDQSTIGSALEAIKVEEPDDDTCLQMLAAHVGLVEAREGVGFSYEALERCVQAARRYVHDRYLPEKAIRLVEEVGVHVRRTRGRSQLVTGEDVAAVVAEKTGVPLTSITEAESERLKRLEVEIHRRIVGQDQAVDLVAQALRRARTELRDPKRPIASLLFLGPTGVGKTELAKTVAEVYFGSEANMVRLDMSEYQAVEALQLLVGTPDGSRVGFLTEAIRRKPFTLLLLDELEKANPDVLNLFLQVMDDARLTDSQGRVVDFTNVIIIATSNAVTSFIQDQCAAGVPIERIRQTVIQEKLRSVFRPEFINRFDAVVVFAPLALEQIESITGRLLAQLTNRLERQRGLALEVKPEAVKELARVGFDPLYGARPLRRAIQDRVENAIASYLLDNQLRRGDTLVLEVGGQITVRQGSRELG